MDKQDIIQRICSGKDVGAEATEMFGHYADLMSYWQRRSEMSERAFGSLSYHCALTAQCFRDALKELIADKADRDHVIQLARMFMASHEAFTRTIDELKVEREELDEKFGHGE